MLVPKAKSGRIVTPKLARALQCAFLVTVVVLMVGGKRLTPIMFYGRCDAAAGDMAATASRCPPVVVLGSLRFPEVYCWLISVSASLSGMLVVVETFIDVSQKKKFFSNTKQQRHELSSDLRSVLHLCQDLGGRCLLLTAGWCRGLAVGWIVFAVLGMERLRYLQLFILVFEGAGHIPLAAILRAYPHGTTARLVSYGCLLGALCAVLSFARSVHPNIAIQSMLFSNCPMEEGGLLVSSSPSDLALRRLTILRVMEKRHVTLYCRSDQLACRLQKLILGIVERDNQLYDTSLHERQLKRRRWSSTSHHRPDCQAFNQVDVALSSSPPLKTTTILQWNIDMLQAAYRVSRKEAEEQSRILADCSEQQALSDVALRTTPLQKDNRDAPYSMGTSPESPFVQSNQRTATMASDGQHSSAGRRKVYSIVDENLVDPLLLNQTLHELGYDREMPLTDYLPYWPPFTYVDRRRYRKSSLFSTLSTDTSRVQPDTLGLRRDGLIGCDMRYDSPDRGLIVSCSYGQGRELDFLMALAAVGSPVWRFELAESFYHGVLTLTQLEVLLGIVHNETTTATTTTAV